MNDSPLHPADIDGDWLVELRPHKEPSGREVFHATFFYDQSKRDYFDGEGWGPDADQAIRASIADANGDD
jgi:hypothetical protein